MAFHRTITHWTGGPGRATAKDKEHYHFITEFDGTVVDGKLDPEDNIVTSDGVYAAHTLNLNKASIGCAMAGMNGAVEHPFSAGEFPLNEAQFKAHCRHLAKIHAQYNIPVTSRTCITHAEVEPTLGVKQRGKWDITRLPWNLEIRGAIAVGDYMRSLVREYMGAQPPAPATSRRTLKPGDRGPDVRLLQELLTSIGYPLGEVDSRFGKLTEQAVMAFQSENGLVKDGWVGSQTWRALDAAPPRKLSEARESLTAADLLERGSDTIKATKGLKKVAETGGGLASVAVVVAQAEEAAALAGKAESLLGTFQALFLTYWPLLLIAVVLFAVWRYANRIEKARVEDARTGKHIGR